MVSKLQDDFLGELAPGIDLWHTFGDEAWHRPVERPWNLSDPNKKVKREYREAKLINTQAKGLGRVELRLEFVPSRGAVPRPQSSRMQRSSAQAWSDHSLRPEDVPDSASVIGPMGGAAVSSTRVDHSETHARIDHGYL